MAYFTIQQTTFFYSSEIREEEQQKIDGFLSILEESKVSEIIKKATEKDRSKGGRIGVNPYRLFAAIIYAFSMHSGTLRKIEDSIIYDIRFMYIMGQEKASYVTVREFLNNVVVKHHRELYSAIVNTIIKKYNIDVSDAFLDGTKLEANVNKYKFVWKPITFHKRLNESILIIAQKWELLIKEKTPYISKEVANMLTSMMEKIVKKNILIQIGKGHRYEPIVKDYLILQKLFLRLLDYEDKEEICGPNRNSFYKTDHDATAMCLKRDYYAGRGSTLHPAYSLQILVSKGLILDYYVSQDRTDARTLIPFLEQFKKDYGYYPKRLCADSGYGSFENYEYLETNGIENYVKHNMWQKMMEGSYVSLYTFDEDKNLTCMNGNPGKEIYLNRHPKGKEALFYKVEGCNFCQFKEYCFRAIKDKEANERIFEASFKLYK